MFLTTIGEFILIRSTVNSLLDRIRIVDELSLVYWQTVLAVQLFIEHTQNFK